MLQETKLLLFKMIEFIYSAMAMAPYFFNWTPNVIWKIALLFCFCHVNRIQVRDLIFIAKAYTLVPVARNISNLDFDLK